jgi:hypothetical protein
MLKDRVRSAGYLTGLCRGPAVQAPFVFKLDAMGKTQRLQIVPQMSGTSEHVNVMNDQGQVGGWVELRWSGRCQTNWARVQNTGGGADLGLEAYLRDRDGRVLEPTRVRGRGRGIYGPMWYAPTGMILVSACGVIESYRKTCTHYH